MRRKLKSLHVLEKVESMALDQLRLELAKCQEHRDRLTREKVQLVELEFQERSLAANQPVFAHTLTAFGDINRLHQQTLDNQISQLTYQVETLMTDIQEHYRESKKLESAIEKSQDILKQLDKQAEQKALDQLAEIRHRQRGV